MLDIDLGVESPITSFADDTRVFREIQSEQDKEVLQRDLNKIYVSMTLELLFLLIVNLKIILQIQLINVLSYQDGY